MGWNIAIGVIVLLGVGGIIVSRSGSSGASAPAVGDHWHARLEVFDCQSGGFLGFVPEFHNRADNDSVQAGIHSHADGFIHIHPFTSDEAGDNATIGKYLDFGGFDLDENGWSLWEGGPRQNGDQCGDGQPGEVRWTVDGEEQSGNPADYHPEDGEVIVLAFVPAGQEIPAAPANESAPTDL